jgi:hypothetical protein
MVTPETTSRSDLRFDQAPLPSGDGHGLAEGLRHSSYVPTCPYIGLDMSGTILGSTLTHPIAEWILRNLGQIELDMIPVITWGIGQNQLL